MRRLAEECQIVPAIIPVDLAGGANNGDWVSLKNYSRCHVVFYAAAGVAGDDPIVKLQQAQKVDGTGTKDILFTDIYKKATAATLLNAIGDFTKVTQTAATQYTDATHAEIQKLYVISIDAEMLDRENGFDCLQVSVADVGAGGAQLGCALYILTGPRYTPPPSAIID